MIQLKLKNPIVFFDLETTGLKIGKDKIVEIAILKINPNQSREEYYTRINPGMPIPKESSEIHGITDEDVKDCPTFREIAHKIKDFIGTSDLAGFNSNRFDIPFLVEEFYQNGIEVDFKKRKMIDVQQIFHKKEKRTLEAAYQFYCNKTLDNAHNALVDTVATYEVLLGQLDKYDDLENDMEFLHQLSNDSKLVDYNRAFVYNDNDQIVFNFGKHKNKTVESVLKKEPQYYDWMMQADFPQDTKKELQKIYNQIMFKDTLF